MINTLECTLNQYFDEHDRLIEEKGEGVSIEYIYSEDKRKPLSAIIKTDEGSENHVQIFYDKRGVYPVKIKSTNIFSKETYVEKHKFSEKGFPIHSSDSIGRDVKRVAVSLLNETVIKSSSGLKTIKSVDPQNIMNHEVWLLNTLNLI